MRRNTCLDLCAQGHLSGLDGSTSGLQVDIRNWSQYELSLVICSPHKCLSQLGGRPSQPKTWTDLDTEHTPFRHMG